MPPRVLICGEPYSGNRMMKGVLRRMGCDAIILHGIGDLPRFAQRDSRKHERARERLDRWQPTHAVMMVRSAVFREESLRAKNLHADPNIADRDAQLLDVCHAVLTYRLPLKAIGYEAFVEDPRGHVDWLAGWLGVEVGDVDLTWIHDGNAKYREDSNG